MKGAVALVTVLALMMAFCFAAHAQEEEWNAVASDFDLASLEEAAPREIVTLFKELHLSPDDPGGWEDFSVGDLIGNRFRELFANELAPWQTLATLAGLAVLAFLARAMQNETGGLSRAASLLLLAAMGLILLSAMGQLFDQIADAIEASLVFQRALLPVYVGLLTATGRGVLAGSYSTMLLGYLQVVGTLNDVALVPLCRMMLAVTLCLPLSGLTLSLDGLRKAVVAGLTALNGLSTAVLSVQSRLSGLTDRAALRAAKATVNAFVPLVGTTLSESLTLILDAVDLAKTTVGLYAIVTVMLLFLPVLVRLLAWRVCLWCAGALFDAVGGGEEKRLLSGVGGLLAILFAVTLACAAFSVLTSLVVLRAGRAT